MWFQAANGRLAKQLQDILEEAGQPVPPGLRQYAQVTGGGGAGGGVWPIPDTHSPFFYRLPTLCCPSALS